jgi:glycosyltransferase involved in cell wall biosynthesis
MQFAMKAEDYHKSLRPLEEACRLAGWKLLTCPLTGGKAKILICHFALVSTVWKNRQRRIFVREFSNLPLLLIFPLIWPLRKKIHFLINHNLQWAVRSSLEGFGLSMLAKMGAQWALFETQYFQCLKKNKGAGSACFQSLENFSIPSGKNLVLPHPVSSDWKKGEKEDQPRVGVAGYYRPEKGMDDLIHLLKEKLPMFGILLGVPNPEETAHLDVETVCTDSDETYFEMISRCDVLVFNGSSDGYFYRASGPIADAAACRTAVVVPDFPIIGKQIRGIGELFQCLEKMPEAVETAVAKVRAGEYDFDSYCATRSAEALADILNGFADG